MEVVIVATITAITVVWCVHKVCSTLLKIAIHWIHGPR